MSNGDSTDQAKLNPKHHAMIKDIDAEKSKSDPVGLDESSEDFPVMRYMSLGKFYHLLSSRTLFMSPFSMLSDSSEGLITEADPNLLKAIMMKQSKSDSEIDKINKNLNEIKTYQIETKEFAFVSSWTFDHGENYALWKLYTAAGEGVAIVTSSTKLRAAISDQCRKAIFEGRVKYFGDLKTRALNTSRFFIKKSAYRYENEFRLVLNLLDQKYASLSDQVKTEVLGKVVKSGGVSLKLRDLSFIESVKVSPFGKFENVVESMMKKFKCNATLVKSSISGS